jgi:hypothetical protein
MFAAFENVRNGEGINRACKSIEEDLKSSDKESLGLH